MPKIENVKSSKESNISEEVEKKEESQEAKQYDDDIQTDKEGLHYSFDGLIDGIIRFTNFNGSSFGGNGGPWLDCVEKMGKWYESNVHTYQGTTSKPYKGKHWYQCPLINDTVADDCSGFVQACLKYFGVDCPKWNSTSSMNSEQFMKLMASSGFTHMEGNWTVNNAQPGDILCGRGGTHTEIYAGNNRSWSWGSIHDASKGGMPAYFCNISSRGGYIHCWRKT